MRPNHLATVALAALLTMGSAAAEATKAPDLTTFCYWYNSAWRCANNIVEYVSCDDGDRNCWFIADYCEGANPDLGTMFTMWFDFSTSGTFVDGRMYADDGWADEVYDYYNIYGGTWNLYSDYPIDIEWNLEVWDPPLYVGRFRVSLSGVTYATYVYVRRVVCK
ncbi:MAG: hypothetical protein RBU30_23075 [Polyangia bacterium]|jgi:hypothetical protein|nr:hypothetical protein [Polyangia bacterium]